MERLFLCPPDGDLSVIRSVAALLAISFLALSCAKEKSPASSSSAPASGPAAALSSNDPCVANDCQKPPKTPKDKKDTSAPVLADEEFLSAQEMAKNATLQCKNNDCNPSVGLLSFVVKAKDPGENANTKKSWNVAQCTASLIAPDVLVTNGHCIPDDLIDRGSVCKGRMWITFGDEAGHPEYDRQIDCATVILRERGSSLDGADLAYLKLARASNRPALRPSQAGIDNGATYQLHKVNPGRVRGGVIGTLQKVECTSRYDSDIFSTPLDKLSRTHLFVGCIVIPGNSGSPILATDGTVRGVIYAYVDKTKIRRMLDKGGAVLPEIADIQDLNVGSNFACLATPEDPDAQALPSACANEEQRNEAKRAALEAARAKALTPAIQPLVAEHLAGHPDTAAFRWSVVTSLAAETGPMAAGVPQCAYADRVAGLLNNKAARISRPFFRLKPTYDKFLKITSLEPSWAGFGKNPEALGLNLENDLYRIAISDAATGDEAMSGTIAACP